MTQNDKRNAARDSRAQTPNPALERADTAARQLVRESTRYLSEYLRERGATWGKLTAWMGAVAQAQRISGARREEDVD